MICGTTPLDTRRGARFEDNEMSIFTTTKLTVTVAAFAVLAGCDDPLDFDLRGNIGAFSTANAVRTITADRPKPDGRGIISYPNYQVAVAKRGDTIDDVAARIGLPVAELAKYNGITPGDALRNGEVLALPRRVAEPVAPVDIASLAVDAINNSPDTTPAAAPVTTTALKPTPTDKPPVNPEPVRHKVKRGETAFTISRLYDVPVKALGEWNGLGSDFGIREGQYLLIPVTGVAAPRRSTDPSTPGQGSPTPTPPSATKPLPDEKIDPTPPQAPDVSVGNPSRPSTARMAFPLEGKIVRAYKKGRNEGIDIAGNPGASVGAAEAGTVAAITEDADGVPIIVVQHGNDLLTIYANVDNITVRKGSRVKRGQKLAEVRDGGKSYVHFEVRNGFDSVDPIPYLE